jgi:hypothetical protein
LTCPLRSSLFVDAGGRTSFNALLKNIESMNSKKGLGIGVDHLFVSYAENGNEKRAKIEHFSLMSAATLGNLSRIGRLYFAAWEQAINDARFGRFRKGIGTAAGEIAKLAELTR